MIVAGNSDEDNPYRKGSAVQVSLRRFESARRVLINVALLVIQTHLLGYEFPSTLMLLGKNKVHFVVSAAKGSFFFSTGDRAKLIYSLTFPSDAAKLLTPIKTPPASAGDEVVEVEILTRSKDEKENAALFEQIVEVIGAGVSTGCG